MAEHDPFTSPYHQVQLPGQQQQPPPGWISPVAMPMPSSSWETAERRRPATLTASFWSWLTATVLVVIGLPGVFALQYERFADVLRADPSGEPMDVPTARVAALVTSVLFSIGFLVLSTPYVVAFINLRGGKEWARIMLAILGAFGLLFGLIMLAAFIGGAKDLNPVVGIFWVLLFMMSTAVAILLMFLPPSNDYVRGSRR
ncbi:MAG: hypothetical protein ABIQ18_45435 [Umezawaea sp.]